MKSLKKKDLFGMLGMTPVKYFRWSHKYYLDNSLEDKRGRYTRNRPRLEDTYRKHVADRYALSVYYR